MEEEWCDITVVVPFNKTVWATKLTGHKKKNRGEMTHWGKRLGEKSTRVRDRRAQSQ